MLNNDGSWLSLKIAKLSVAELKAYYFTINGILKAVDGINLEIYDGESLGIAGESACGKAALAALF